MRRRFFQQGRMGRRSVDGVGDCGRGNRTAPARQTQRARGEGECQQGCLKSIQPVHSCTYAGGRRLASYSCFLNWNVRMPRRNVSPEGTGKGVHQRQTTGRWGTQLQPLGPKISQLDLRGLRSPLVRTGESILGGIDTKTRTNLSPQKVVVGPTGWRRSCTRGRAAPAPLARRGHEMKARKRRQRPDSERKHNSKHSPASLRRACRQGRTPLPRPVGTPLPSETTTARGRATARWIPPGSPWCLSRRTASLPKDSPWR